MRIAVVTDTVSAARGGNESYLLSLMACLVRAGHDVHVFFNRGRPSVEGPQYQTIRPAGYPRFLREWRFCRKVDDQVKRLAADAVLTVRPLSSATHYRLSNGIHLQCFEAEREAFDSPWRRLFYRTGLRLNPKQQLLIQAQNRLLTGNDRPRLMTNSDVTRRRLQEVYGISPSEVTLLYSGVDLDLFKAGKRDAEGERRQKLLFVGHHFVLKGLHCLMAALASDQCADLDLTLQVVGNGRIRQFSKLAARLGISSKVEFLGSVSRTVMPDLYCSSAVLVHPTFYDPCSLATLEAMACGCPVITTRRNGACELIESGRNGFVIDHPRHVAGLAEAIRGAICCPELTRETGRAAAATARQRLNLSDHVEAVIKWLEG